MEVVCYILLYVPKVLLMDTWPSFSIPSVRKMTEDVGTNPGDERPDDVKKTTAKTLCATKLCVINAFFQHKRYEVNSIRLLSMLEYEN